MDKIKVYYIIASAEAASDKHIGGGETQLLSLIKKLDKKRFHPTVVYPERGLFEKYVGELGVDRILVRMRLGLGVKSIFVLYSLLKNEKVDIIHTCEPRAGFVGTMVARLAGVPVCISTSHLPYFPPFIELRRKAFLTRVIRALRERFTFGLTDRIITVSEENRAEKIRLLKVSPDKIVTIHNGVDPDEFSGTIQTDYLRKELRINKDDLVVGNVGRLAYEKGQNYLLHAAANIVNEIPRAVFLVVGEGDKKSDLMKMAREMGLDNKVIFTGFRRDIKNILALIDVLALPSLDEGNPMVIIEAMMLGKPVVASKLPCLEEIIEDGVNGFTVPPRNHKALASVIVRLLKDRKLAKRMGQQAQRIAHERFSVHQMVTKVETLYQDLFDRKQIKRHSL